MLRVFDALFSFRGRLDRTAYVRWAMLATLLVFLIFIAFLGVGVVLAQVFSADGMGPTLLGIMTAAVAAGVGVWSSFALQAKRLRDMGFDPLHWMVGVAALLLIDQWVLPDFTDLRVFWPTPQSTPFGALVGMGYFVLLLCWPSAEPPSEQGGLRDIDAILARRRVEGL